MVTSALAANPWYIASLAVLAACVALLLESWHFRRVFRLGRLAFGPRGRPRSWTLATIPLRAAGLGATCWGLLTLLALSSKSPDSPAANTPATDQSVRRLVILLDVSPSMDITDAGPDGESTRATRARDLLRSVLARMQAPDIRTSVVAFYSKARPVVVDTFDPDVIANVLDDLPLEHVFTAGKTDLYAGVKAAAELGRAWPAARATLIVVSDGDTLPETETLTLPPAFGRALVVGVGSSRMGTYIDGHSSIQDVVSLRRLAARLKGRYHDGNARHVPSEELAGVSLEPDRETHFGRREAALAATASGALLLALIPLCLALAGGTWPPRGSRNQQFTHSSASTAGGVT